MFGWIGDALDRTQNLFKGKGLTTTADLTSQDAVNISKKNYEEQKRQFDLNFRNQQEQQQYDRDLQRQIFEREDNAVFRRMEDLKNSGLNPVLAAGSAANSGQALQGSAPQGQAAQHDTSALQNRAQLLKDQMQNNFNNFANMAGTIMQMMQMRSNINATDSQAALNFANANDVSAAARDRLSGAQSQSAHAAAATSSENRARDLHTLEKALKQEDIRSSKLTNQRSSIENMYLGSRLESEIENLQIHNNISRHDAMLMQQQQLRSTEHQSPEEREVYMRYGPGRFQDPNYGINIDAIRSTQNLRQWSDRFVTGATDKLFDMIPSFGKNSRSTNRDQAQRGKNP